ncbi:hypothetical protein EIP86_002939 [Pleurotus ostreatoroseus]|nr:hypothetical protein EIP86_002939 [Pleurotus ostreatoroseus]
MASSYLAPSGDWSFEDDQLYEAPVSPSSAYIVESPSALQDEPPSPAVHRDQHTLSREVSEDDSLVSDSGHGHSSPHSQKIGSFPDPSQYPDPYPSYRPPRWQHGMSTPALSSADSSTASTRSSAYTNSARSGDYGHVHVAIGGTDDPNMSTGISTEDVAKLLARESGYSSSQGRSPHVDQGRWSDVYAQSVRSRSSSVGNGKVDSVHESSSPALHGAPSFDRGWEIVDERDEMGLTSEDETDDDVLLDDDDDEELEQPTSAMMVAEEGRGVIVRGGEGPIVQLQVHPGTTHLLIGSSSTPNAVPSFLTSTIPNIAHTLLALDISANFLVALPPALHACVCLEELNIASNPLRALPVFLAGLTSLRVLIADSTGLSTLPPALSALDKLHALSVRRNKMNSLPSWLCLLPSLETLLVDGNPFQGPWKALVDPLLAKVPTTPLYPLSTPLFPLPSSSMASMRSNATDTDHEGSSESPGLDPNQAYLTGQDEDTIMPPRAGPLMRSVTSPVPGSQDLPSPASLSRTRTTPNRAYYDKYRTASRPVPADKVSPSMARTVSGESMDREVRRMKSAGELRRNAGHGSPALPSSPAPASPQRPSLVHYSTSVSSSNLLATASAPQDSQGVPKRFASLGVSSALSSASTRTRPTLDHSIWDDISAEEEASKALSPIPDIESPAVRPSMGSTYSKRDRESSYTPEPRPKEETKSNRWGFLKKMSMGKMRNESSLSSRPSTSQGRSQFARPPSKSVSATVPEGSRSSLMPQIDVRISTTGSLLHPSGNFIPGLSKKPSSDMLKVAPPASPIPEVSVESSSDASDLQEAQKPPPSPSPSQLLSPTGPTPRSSKRRSFLPFDVSPIPIPAASTFMPGVTATNGDDEEVKKVPSPIITENLEQMQRKEDDRAREARIRALRSVMAYLRDMYDLGLTQQPNTLSVYGGSPDPAGGGTRSRRPTVVDNGRMPSEISISSTSSSTRSDGSSHLRSAESRMGLRSMGSAQTNSVATVASVDSTGSGEERKYKDDRSKRARILREIVETERTYVKGLQELVDIYIKPAAAPVSALGSVGQSTVPSAERKIVFGGLEALFSFHKQSFLPALERATAPVMRSAHDLADLDSDGRLSLEVARAVANIFVSHAAFMKMYSTYIK